MWQGFQTKSGIALLVWVAHKRQKWRGSMPMRSHTRNSQYLTLFQSERATVGNGSIGHLTGGLTGFFGTNPVIEATEQKRGQLSKGMCAVSQV
jgi:hypothetical protein